MPLNRAPAAVGYDDRETEGCAMIRLWTTVLLLVLATSAQAQEDERFLFGGDAFLAGDDLVLQDLADDVFMAGDTIEMQASATGSAHLAGRRVEVTGDIGGDLYGVGMNVRTTGAVAGDASVTGYGVRVGGAVGGDLRAAGSSVAVTGPVGGYALLAGETVTLDATIEGDASISAETVTFGEGAVIRGNLTIYNARPDSVEVPEAVISPDRITRRTVEEGEFKGPDLVPGWRGVAAGLVGSVVATGLAATLLAAVAPGLMADLRRTALARPFRTLWLGFLAMSLLSGAVFVLAVTLVGILVSPAALILALIVVFIGYVVGVYVFGVGLLNAFGRGEPHGIGDRALAAFVGAAAAALATLIPLLGWIFGVALALVGVGALAVRLLRPRFFADRPA